MPRYLVVVEPIREEGFDGYYSATVPSLDLTTHGVGVEGALHAARELVEAWVAEKRAHGEEIPEEPDALLAHIRIGDAVHSS